jgi:formylglycine-generating enzyme required for sulfatase activity
MLSRNQTHWPLVGLLLLLMTPAHALERFALIIGNSAYEHASLINPHYDANDMAQTLEELGFTVTLKENLNKRAIHEAINEFSSQLEQSHGVGLFYYAGHGVEVDGINYIIPLEAQIETEVDVKYAAVDIYYLLEHMESAKNFLNVIIIDACRNNPFSRNFSRSLVNRGVSRMSAPIGSIIASSTAQGSIAGDGAYGRNSPYTKHLLHFIRQPDLSIEQVFKEVRKAVLEETDGRQVPWETSSLTSEFYFVSTPPPQPPDNPPPDARQQAELNIRTSTALEPEMILIKGGCFQMGSPESEPDRHPDERQHQTCVDDFYLGKYEVTVREFKSFVTATDYRPDPVAGTGCWIWDSVKNEAVDKKDKSWRDPGYQQDDNHPVVCLSWQDIRMYLTWLSRHTGATYQLPTEAQWEYAARAGTMTARYWGNNPDQACLYANVHDRASQRDNGFDWTAHDCDDGMAQTAPVGHYGSNDYGLYDMLGNAWEWTCSEWDESYGGKETRCPDGQPTDASALVLRGGSWFHMAGWVRSAGRFKVWPSFRFSSLGFRVAKTR